MVDNKTKQELNALSKEVFGSSSRWVKLVENGYAEIVTEEVEEMVPSEKEGEEPTLQKVKKPLLTKSGQKQSVVKRHTVESIRELMISLKTAREEYLARRKKMQEDYEAAQQKIELSKKVHQQTSGSAV